MRKVLESVLGKMIRVTLLLDGNLDKIKIDPDQMATAILVLAANAHEAMPEGGTRTIETRQTCVDATQVASSTGATGSG